MAELRKRGIVTKVRSLKTGQTIGGIAFTRGPLAHLLRNRFYIGEVVFKGEVLPGEQPAILDRDLFDAVQAKLNDQRTNHTAARAKSDSLLTEFRFRAEERSSRERPRRTESDPKLPFESSKAAGPELRPGTNPPKNVDPPANASYGYRSFDRLAKIPRRRDRSYCQCLSSDPPAKIPRHPGNLLWARRGPSSDRLVRIRTLLLHCQYCRCL